MGAHQTTTQPAGEPTGSNEARTVRIDPRLLAKAQKGDREAIRRLIEPEAPKLFSVCLRMLGPTRREDAQDLAHDAIVKIIRGLPGFDGRSSFGTWATRVAMNACLSRLRAEGRRRDAMSREIPMDPVLMDGAGSGREKSDSADISALGSGHDRELGPASGVEVDERRRLLLVGLTQLSPEHRAVLVLRDIRDLDYERIGSVLGVSVGTVKSRLFRARAGLRKWIEERAGDNEAGDNGAGESGEAAEEKQ